MSSGSHVVAFTRVHHRAEDNLPYPKVSHDSRPTDPFLFEAQRSHMAGTLVGYGFEYAWGGAGDGTGIYYVDVAPSATGEAEYALNVSLAIADKAEAHALKGIIK